MPWDVLLLQSQCDLRMCPTPVQRLRRRAGASALALDAMRRLRLRSHSGTRPRFYSLPQCGAVRHCLAFIRCVGALPFSARHTRVASAAKANVLSVYPLTPPLQPHVLRHLLVRCLQECIQQASAHSAGRFARQLRRDGKTAPAAAARRLSCSCLRCGLRCLRVTRCCADCGVLCVRCGGREDAVSMVEDG